GQRVDAAEVDVQVMALLADAQLPDAGEAPVVGGRQQHGRAAGHELRNGALGPAATDDGDAGVGEPVAHRVVEEGKAIFQLRLGLMLAALRECIAGARPAMAPGPAVAGGRSILTRLIRNRTILRRPTTPGQAGGFGRASEASSAGPAGGGLEVVDAE